MHEDGLADVADAIRAGRSREKILEILKDSRIGTYGALALIVSVLIRIQALAQTSVQPLYGLASAMAISRASMLAVAGFTPPAGDGLGRSFAAGITRSVLLTALGQALLIALLAGPPRAFSMLFASATTVLLLRLWFMRRLGGVNGDCMGATCQAVETVNLVILAWQHSS